MAERTFTCFGGACTVLVEGDGAVLDPATGRPAYTGVVQVTALAPTALEGEALAKAAVLSGPEDAATWLPHGGVVVLDDRTHTVVG